MTGKNFDTLNDAYEPGRKLDKILLHVGYDDAEEWKGIVSSDEDDTQLIIPFAVSYLLGSTRRAKTADQASSEFDRDGRNYTTVTTGTNRMRRSILILAAAIALCAAIMNTGATAAYGRGRHWVSDHFRSDFGHRAFRRGDQRHRFVPSLEPWDWGGGWWAGYHYWGGWAYQYGYAPYSCYIFGGG